RAELTVGAPEAAHRPEHELAAGLFAEQGEAVGKQVLKREMLALHLVQEAAPRLLWRADERGKRADCIERSGKPPVIEVRTPHTRVHVLRRRGDADRMMRPHIKLGEVIVQEHDRLTQARELAPPPCAGFSASTLAVWKSNREASTKR